MKDIEKLVNLFSAHTNNSEVLNNIVRVHSGLLLKWQKIVNLIGLSDERDIADFLYLDSFFALKTVTDFLKSEGIVIKEISDIGSGAGFPSLFWTYFISDAEVVFYEPKRKKANFLRDFIRLSAFGNYSVKEEMVGKDTLRTQLIVSKAAINIHDWPGFGISNLGKGGILLSLLTQDSLGIYKESLKRTGKVGRSFLFDYILPYSDRKRFVGVVVRK